MNVSTTHAITIAGLVVAASVVGVAVPALGATDAKTIDACRTISEPGVYHLETDLTDPEDSASACIEVESDDVVIDGNGHRITMTESEDYLQTPYAIRADGVENVTVTNLTAAGWGEASSFAGTALTFANVSDVTVTDLVVSENAWNGVTVRHADDVTVRDVNLTGGGIGQMLPFSGAGIRFEDVDDATVRGSAAREWQTALEVEASANVSIAETTIGGVGDWSDPYSTQTENGVWVDSSTNVTIRENTITQTYDGVVLGGSTSGTVVADNDISVNRRGISVGVTGAEGGSNVIRNNTISENALGVQTSALTSPLRIVGNRITDGSTGIEVEDSELCGPGPEGGELLAIHENVVANNTAGIDNDDSDVVNATRNYWGAASGPSSVTDSDAPYGETDPEVPLKDPVTGTLADGAGDTVTEFPAPRKSGLSNVHFDPWLEMPPTGTENATTETV